MSFQNQVQGNQKGQLIDYSLLSDESIIALQQYMDYQARETVTSAVCTQRVVKEGRVAAIGYAALLQDLDQAIDCFPNHMDEFNEIAYTVLGELKDIIRGKRRY